MDIASRVIRLVTSGLLVIFAQFASLFAAGYAYEDFELWQAVALTVAWLLLAGGLSWTVWRRTDSAVPVILVVLIVVAAAAVIDSQTRLFGWDTVGPVVTVVVLALMVPLGVLGMRRAASAGMLLLILGAFQAYATLAQGDEVPLSAALTSSTGAIVLPILASAVLLLLAGWLEHMASRKPVDPAVS